MKFSRVIKRRLKLLRPSPDRTATQFRNSPQGSFFDGSDHVELLKERQNRLFDRQMREMFLRKQAQQKGGTFHVDRHKDNVFDGDRASLWSGTGRLTPVGVSESQIVYHADAQRELEERARQEAQRQLQTRQTHSHALERRNRAPVVEGIFNRAVNEYQLQQERQPAQQEPVFQDVEDTEDELIPAEDEKLPKFQS